MTVILALLTVMACIGIKSLAKKERQIHIAEEGSVRRVRWGWTEEAFSKC